MMKLQQRSDEVSAKVISNTSAFLEKLAHSEHLPPVDRTMAAIYSKSLDRRVTPRRRHELPSK